MREFQELITVALVLVAILSVIGHLRKMREKMRQASRRRQTLRVPDERLQEPLASDVLQGESEVERQIRLFREQKQQTQRSVESSVETHATSNRASPIRRDQWKQSASRPTSSRLKSQVLPIPSHSSGTIDRESNMAMRDSVTQEGVANAASVSPSLTTSLITVADVSEMLHDRQSVARVFILGEVLRRPW